ncbi:MAG: hypothetical protein ACYC0B_11535, partial [Gemmatimonadaceae bacterium]
LNRGFEVLAVVEGYLRHDPESLGWAALIEWLNPAVATDAHRAGRDPRFAKPVREPVPDPVPDPVPGTRTAADPRAGPLPQVPTSE